jgi:hypothetical protein
LKFNRPFEKLERGVGSMLHGAVLPRNVAQPGEVPLLVRFVGKLVLEVLPAALASVIGAFLFAHYQFDHTAASTPPAEPAMAATPASAQMMQLVREEHAMIRKFLVAQQAAELNQAIAANAADARAVAGAKLAAALPRHSTSLAAAKPAVTRGVASAAVPDNGGATATALPTVLVAAVQPSPAVEATPAPPPSQPSLMARTLAVPGRVATVTLHAVMAIGGIPSWIGHRFGGDLESASPLPSAS